MSQAVNDLFPFDGTCAASRNADLTIKFSPYQSPLKANSGHLKEASPVLKTALEDCKHDGTLDAGDDNREAWVFLLNLVHPGRRIGFLELSECSDLARMERYASLAHKYDVQCMTRHVCCGLRRVLDDEKARMPLSVSSQGANQRLSKAGKLFGCSRIAIKFGLELTKTSVLSYLDQLLQGMATTLVGSRSNRPQMKNLVADFVNLLSKEGDHQFTFQVADKAIRSEGC